MPGMQNKEEWAVIEASLLRVGDTLDCDLYRGSQILLQRGSEISEGFLETLSRQNIGFVRVSGSVAEKLKKEFLKRERENSRYHENSVLGDSVELRGGVYFEGAISDKESELYKRASLSPAIRRDTIQNVVDHVRRAFYETATNGAFDQDILRAPVREMVLELIAHPYAALKLLDVKHYSDYTVTHAVNVALLFVALIRSHIPKDKIMEMAMGALLHDIGKARIANEIIEKRSELTDEEYSLIKTHTIIGYKILTGKCGFNLDTADLALSHHERWNGKGYPRGCEKFSLPIQIISLCDVYDALTTTRSYRTKIDFYSALSIVIKESGTGFSPFAVKMLIERIGLFPIGSFVILNNGRIGVVIGINLEEMYKPKICILHDTPNDPVDPPFYLDLATNPNLAIARTLTLVEVMRLVI